MKSRHILIVVLLAIIMTSPVLGQVPQLVNYQGRLTDGAGTPVANGPYLIKFKIYGSLAGADSLYSSGFQTVQVTDGLFTYQIGTGTPLPANLFSADTTRYLGITVGTDSEISPRTRLTSVGYAYQAENADTADYAALAAGVVSGAIADIHVSPTAAIAPSKINGTAATLSDNQTFTGINTFNTSAYFGDSTMTIAGDLLTIGDRTHFNLGTLLYTTRSYNTSQTNSAHLIGLYNSSTGNLTGVNCDVMSTTAGSGGAVKGFDASAISDGATRYGVYAKGQARNSAITTGNSYGIYAGAYDGANAYGIYAAASSATVNYAGYFSGDVNVTGTLSKGGGAFKIDHPLDPENKYLQHSFVESPDMMNVYNGNITTDGAGYAVVTLPDYFAALNKDFRYQLTVIRSFAQAIVAEEISGNTFTIQTDKPHIKVSWQVTGIRQDKWADANRIKVELDKRPEDRGKYLHPEAYNLPVEQSVDYENIRNDRQPPDQSQFIIEK
jgi:hypothetical protein